MSQVNTSLTVLGLEISFRPGADMERVQKSARLLEELYSSQREKTGGRLCKEALLVFLALGLADDLLQSRKKWDEIHLRIESLLSKIGSSL